MAEKVKFQPQTFDINSINGGNRYGLEGIQPEAVNAPIEAAAYAQALATNQPNIENAGLVGTPSVSIEKVDGLPRFKFQNLKGEKGIDGKDHSEEIAQLNEKLETYFISAKEQIDINSEEISKNSAKIHNLTGALLEGGVMGVVEVSQAFTTRQTADGENIIDNQNIFPKKIAGSTQNCYSLVDFSSAKTTGGLTVTANNNTLTITGTPEYDYAAIFEMDITDLLEDGKTYNLYQSVIFEGSTGAFYIQVNVTNASTGGIVGINPRGSTGRVSFVCDKTTNSSYVLRLQSGTIENVGTINSTISFMLYEGTDEKPYQPYFKGLKNAYFEKVVSTGRNLIDFITPFAASSFLRKPFSLAEGTYTLQVICDDYDGQKINVVSVDFLDENYNRVLPLNAGSMNGINRWSTFSITAEEVERTRYIFVYMNGETGADLIGKEIKLMLNHGTEALPYEPYTESELGFSSSPDLAVVEEVAHVNDSSEIAEEAAQYNNSVIYLSDMSNVHVGMLVDFYMDGTIISGATARQIMFLDTEAKYIVIDGADPMENVPIDTTVRRSAQVKLPEWDSYNPQTGELTVGTKTIAFDGTEDWEAGTTNRSGVYRYRCTVERSSNFSENNIGNIVSNLYKSVNAVDTWMNVTGFAVDDEVLWIYDTNYTTSDVSLWKAHLAELAAAGNPLVIAYQLATPTVIKYEDIPKRFYTAWNGGSETQVQGNTDNSEYGAMCTLTNDYFVKVGGATNEQTE